MEKIYGCGNLDYTSDPINLLEFLNEASSKNHPFLRESEILQKKGVRHTKDEIQREREKMMKAMDITLSDAEFCSLKSICSPDNFRVADVQGPNLQDIKMRSTLYERIPIPKSSKFLTLRSIKSRKRIHERFLKYSGSIWLDTKATASNNKREPDLVPGNELLITVRKYAPFYHDVGTRFLKVATGFQEIFIIGSQTLAQLRDSFTCPSDNAVCQNISSNPNVKNFPLAKDKYKSGMMYIENKFYNDTRCPTNLDYSEVILKWASEKSIDVGTTAIMENTRISDLTVRLGYPYLYQHQGRCEHLFCFSDVRLLHPSDYLHSSAYPFLKSIGQHQSHYCMTCGLYVAKWITSGNMRVPHDPCYFCQNCFMSYNYLNGKPVGNFKAYPLITPDH